MTSPEFTKQLGGMGMIVKVGTPADFDQLIRGEISKWRPVVERLGLRGKN